MAREPIAGMMDNVPSQLDMEDLAAEVELELPGSMDDNVVSFEGMAEGMDIEMIPEEDGGVTIDFDTLGENGDESKDTITLRDRDTMEQTRMPISELLPFLLEKIR